MSPVRVLLDVVFLSVPRASGDEPLVNANETQIIMCSPRERG